jgi:outer membrane protein
VNGSMSSRWYRQRLQMIQKIICFLILIGTSIQPLFASMPLSLEKAFQTALKHSESIRIQEAVIEEAKENHWQTKATVLPTFQIEGSYLKQETYSSQRQTKLTLTQPLFQGLDEFYAPRGTAADLASEEWTLRQKKEDLFESLAGSYFDLLKSIEDRKHLSQKLTLIKERVAALEKRKRIGRSRKSEVLTARSQLALLEVEIAQAEIQLIESRQNFEFYLGEPLENRTLMVPEFELPKMIAWSEVEKKLPEQTSLKVLRADLESAEASVSSAWTGHIPSVELTSNYYLSRSGGFYSSARWDATISLTVPIFQGGIIQSQVREAAANQKQADLALRKKEREEYRDAKKLYDQAHVYLRLLKEYDKAVELSQSNYQEQKQEYERGLVSNLDVLDSLQMSIDTQRKRDSAFFDFHLAISELKLIQDSLPF